MIYAVPSASQARQVTGRQVRSSESSPAVQRSEHAASLPEQPRADEVQAAPPVAALRPDDVRRQQPASGEVRPPAGGADQQTEEAEADGGQGRHVEEEKVAAEGSHVIHRHVAGVVAAADQQRPAATVADDAEQGDDVTAEPAGVAGGAPAAGEEFSGYFSTAWWRPSSRRRVLRIFF